MNVTQFFELYGNRLVKVNHDDVETGDFRLLPEEYTRAYNFYLDGYEVFSVFDTPNGDEDVKEILKSNAHPYISGYFIIEPAPASVLIPSTIRSIEELEAKLAKVEAELERKSNDDNSDHEDNQYIWEGWKEALEWVLKKN